MYMRIPKTSRSKKACQNVKKGTYTKQCGINSLNVAFYVAKRTCAFYHCDVTLKCARVLLRVREM